MSSNMVGSIVFSAFHLSIACSMVGSIVFSAFHLSIACSIFMFLKRASETFANSEPKDIRAMDVFFILLLNALVMFVIEVLPPKGAIPRYLSRLHTFSNALLHFLFCFIAISAHRFLIKGSIESWLYAIIVISEALFLALHAPKEISYEVSRTLSFNVAFLLCRDLQTGNLANIITGGIAWYVTSTVHVHRLGGLRYPNKDQDNISSRVPV